MASAKVIATMAARLGLDPSEFLEKIKGVQGANAFASEEMRREWKKTGRDGQEAIRLIDEAIGIHVARPVARIIAETLPGLSKALSSVLSGVAFGAIGIALFEFGEHISKQMEEAQKRQDEYTEAVRKTKTTFAETSAENEKSIQGLRAKLAELKGDTKAAVRFKIAEIDAESVIRLAKQVDALTEAERKEQSAAEQRMGTWAAIAGFWHELWSSDAELSLEKMDQGVRKFQETFADMAREDALKGTTTAADYLDRTLKEAQATLIAMQTVGFRTEEKPIGGRGPMSHVPVTASEAEIDAQQRLIKALNDGAEAYKRQNDEQAKLEKQKAQEEATKKATELAEAHARELRNELDAVTKLSSGMKAKADAEELAANATAKGSQASIEAAAAAQSQKAIADFTAAANDKYFSQTNNKIAATKAFQQALAEAIPQIQQAAIVEQAFKAAAEERTALGELSGKGDERLKELELQAAGLGKVATEQAKESALLQPLQQRLAALRSEYDRLRDTLGATDVRVVAFGDVVNKAAADYDAASAKVGKVNSAIQQNAFGEEMRKLRDELAQSTGAAASPWAKIDAEAKKLTEDLKLTPAQAAQVKQALSGLQTEKGQSELKKLDEKLREVNADVADLAKGSNLGKIDTEVQKLTHELGLTAEQAGEVRNRLIAIQQAQVRQKAFGLADSINPAGTRVQEIRQEIGDLQELKKEWASAGQSVEPINRAIADLRVEEDNIVVKTGDVDAGFHLWMAHMKADAQSDGQFAFDILTQATKGFEDALAKTLTLLQENHRGTRHWLQELGRLWESYFAGLEEKSLKFLLSKGFSALFGTVFKGPQGAGTGGGAAPGTGAPGQGQSAGTQAADAGQGGLRAALAAISSGGKKDASGAQLAAAATQLQAAGTQLIAAATTLQAAATSMAASGGAGAGEGAGSAISAGFAAEGGVESPGSSFIAGEAGAEEISLGQYGGARVTPLAAASNQKGGGVVYQDFSGAVVSDDLMRKADAAHLNALTENRAVARSVSMMRDINRRWRPSKA